ncbi:MAG: type II secretion system protein [Patescibacteria group bacterium]|nr:type II secretion system protein [Patescibacteria group bacterium]MDD5164817.1 type II secretion system protein [Patescibacteria group bacterium]MDD5534457.1 type II secretion system protein [Patescibacteria group bacterium]
MEKKNKKGFTLIELLVVVAIMGLMAALAIISLNQARAKARDARRVADVKQIQTALELYYMDKDKYPDAPAPTVLDGSKCLGNGGFAAQGSCTAPIYMGLIPTNPAPMNDGSCSTPNSSYTYAIDGGATNTSYHIRWCLGAKTGELGAGIHHATPAGLVDGL